jgi:hypothetical protein
MDVPPLKLESFSAMCEIPGKLPMPSKTAVNRAWHQPWLEY